MGHTRCDKPLTYIKINKAHNNAPLSTCSLCPGARTPVAPSQNDQHINTMMRCQYGGRRRRAWVTRVVISHSPTQNKATPTTCPQTHGQHAPLSERGLHSATTNTYKYTRCCTTDIGVDGDGPGSHTPCNMPCTSMKGEAPDTTPPPLPPKKGLCVHSVCPDARP